MVGGIEMTGCSRLDAGSAAGGAKGGAELIRVTGNHMETMDSSDPRERRINNRQMKY